MNTTVTEKTADDNFAAAFRYALNQGIIQFGMIDFQGWQDDCDCAACRNQRIIFDYLWPSNQSIKQDVTVNDSSPGLTKEQVIERVNKSLYSIRQRHG